MSDVSDVQLRKAELRAQVLARRSALPADQRTAAGKLIRDAVLAAPQVQMAGTIAAYYSVGTEPGHPWPGVRAVEARQLRPAAAAAAGR